jgi:hypothetical protein
VLVNQRPIATATADEQGEWVAVTEKKIGSGDHQFALTARLGRDGAPIYGQIVGRSVASPSPNNNKVMPAKVSEAVSPGQLPRPITFVYDQTTFTAEGRRAARMLAEYLRTRRQRPVTLGRPTFRFTFLRDGEAKPHKNSWQASAQAFAT